MYCTVSEVRAIATGMSEGAKSASTPATVPSDTISKLIERASRYIDLCCGVEPGYFEPAYYPVWESLHVYAVGDVITPITRNDHTYRVTTAGTSSASEPTFPTSSGSTVTNGTVTFTENGADVAASNKTIYGDGTNYLKLPPYVPGTLNTSITVPSNYTAPTFIEKDGYLIFASNGIGPAGLRYTTGWYGGVPFTASAIWGFESVPEDVKMAVIEMVINLWRETDPALAKLTNVDGGILREAMPPRVREIAKRYRAKGAAFI